MKRNRRRAERKGRLAEYYAAFMLLIRGWKVLAVRYKSVQGEIDLIVCKGEVVAMCEVKARSSVEACLYAVNPQSQKRISAAARIWLAANPWANSKILRFDIVAITPPMRFLRIENAFETWS